MQPVDEGGSPRTFITPVLPEAIRQLLEPLVDPCGRPTARRLLGVDAPPILSARPGKLLSNHLLPMIHSVRDALMVESTEGRTAPKPKYLGGHIEVGTGILIYLKNILYTQLRRELTLSCMRWPLTHPRSFLQITAEDLPAWELDLATDFARLTGTEIYGCDLRVEPVFAETKPLLTLIDLAELTDRAARTAVFRTLCQLEPPLRALKSFEDAVQRHYGNRLDERPTLFRDATRRQLQQAFTDFNKERFPTGQVK
jgi:hypothetical protein